MSNRYDKIKGDCLTHCLAQLLNVDYRQVPYFAKESRQAEWVDRLEAWSLKKGYVCEIVNDAEDINNIAAARQRRAHKELRRNFVNSMIDKQKQVKELDILT